MPLLGKSDGARQRTPRAPTPPFLTMSAPAVPAGLIPAAELRGIIEDASDRAANDIAAKLLPRIVQHLNSLATGAPPAEAPSDDSIPMKVQQRDTLTKVFCADSSPSLQRAVRKCIMPALHAAGYTCTLHSADDAQYGTPKLHLCVTAEKPWQTTHGGTHC
jgi:hypothetical protein